MKKLFFYIILAVFLFGCTTTKTLVAHQNTTEKFVSDNQRVTFYVDTVFEHYFDTVKITQHGDTIFQTEIKYRYKYLYKSRLDTVVKNDTVYLNSEISSVQVTEKKDWFFAIKVILITIGSTFLIFIGVKLYSKFFIKI